MSPSPFSEKSGDTWCIKQKYQDNTLLSLLYVCLNLTYQKIPPPPPPHQPTCIEINLQSKRQEYSNSKHVCRKKLIQLFLAMFIQRLYHLHRFSSDQEPFGHGVLRQGGTKIPQKSTQVLSPLPLMGTGVTGDCQEKLLAGYRRRSFVYKTRESPNTSTVCTTQGSRLGVNQ